MVAIIWVTNSVRLGARHSLKSQFIPSATDLGVKSRDSSTDPRQWLV